MKLVINTENGKPINFKTARAIPVNQERASKAYIRDLVEASTLSEVTPTTPWCSRGTFREKAHGKLWLTVDYRRLSTSIA